MPEDRSLVILRHMIRTRALEERMIKMSKSGEGYFWIGGPGEEAFNVCLGLHVKKGQGPDFDYLHLHYRNSGVMLAMGMDMLDAVRQMAMTATDPFSRGRNFAAHYARKAWNVVPVSSVIEVQFTQAPGTALVQKRHGGDGVSIVVGGEAGTSEGDFATCLIWSSRPGHELPVLMAVTNNGWGISTPFASQCAAPSLVERGKAFGIRGEVVDGNDVEATWDALDRAFAHCRGERRPFLLEARVSRLYGHSSSSGAARSNEPDCIARFEERLLHENAVDRDTLDRWHREATDEADAAVATAMQEARPTADDVEMDTYAASRVDRVYPHDYTGLP